MESAMIKRDVAIKVYISDILEGKYVKDEGWKPNYIITSNDERVSRVNIVGVVVSGVFVEENGQSISVDDGSGRIVLRSFQDGLKLVGFPLGCVVNVIGKPREYMNDKYIIPEIVKILKDKCWLAVRKKELSLKPFSRTSNISDSQIRNNTLINNSTVSEEVVDDYSIKKTETVSFGVTDSIIDLIKRMDSGPGVFIDDLIERANVKDIDRVITSLLENGEIFEVQPGRVKVLE